MISVLIEKGEESEQCLPSFFHGEILASSEQLGFQWLNLLWEGRVFSSSHKKSVAASS